MQTQQSQKIDKGELEKGTGEGMQTEEEGAPKRRCIGRRRQGIKEQARCVRRVRENKKAKEKERERERRRRDREREREKKKRKKRERERERDREKREIERG